VRRSQRGQALVGALVIMLILFALAGGVAVAASGLLQQSRVQMAAFDDLAAQSATSDAVSQVAGSSSQCTPQATSGLFPRITGTEGTVLGVRFPDTASPQNDASTTAYCVRVDHISSTVATDFATEIPWSGRCASMPLPDQEVSLFFDARGISVATPFAAYVDDDATPVCRRKTLPDTDSCSNPSATKPCIQCGKTLGRGGDVAQLKLDCDLTDPTPGYLHIYNGSGANSPARVFLTTHDDSGGSVYLIATQVASGGYEEAVLHVRPSGGGSLLLYRAVLP